LSHRKPVATETTPTVAQVSSHLREPVFP
jgi:hypothetical protein